MSAPPTHTRPPERDLSDWIEDAGFVLLLVSGAAIVAVILALLIAL